MEVYNWQQKDWTNFRFSLKKAENYLLLFSEKRAGVSGMLEGLPEETRQDCC